MTRLALHECESEAAKGMDASDLWIFGYGSVIWKNGEIAHAEKVEGFIEGFKRRFWHGSVDHRGRAGAPGRVVSVFSKEDMQALDVEGDDMREVGSEDGWRVYGSVFRVTKEHRDKVRLGRQDIAACAYDRG